MWSFPGTWEKRMSRCPPLPTVKHLVGHWSPQGTGESGGRPFTYEEICGGIIMGSLHEESLWMPHTAVFRNS
jgi:hypothetical protein